MSYDLMLKNAMALHENGHLNEAEQIYRQILETVPNHPAILNLLGLIAQDKGEQDEAISLFMQAIRNNSDEVAYYYNLAFSFKLKKRYKEALDCFIKVREMKPEIKETYNEIALLYQINGNLSEARKNWSYALSLDKKFVDAKVNIVMSYKNENIGKTIDDMEKIATEFSEEGVVFYYLATLYFDKKQWEKAWTNAIKAKRLAPASDEVRTLLGKLAYQDKQLENAKIYFAKAELLNPYNIDAIRGLADIYSLENDFEEAEFKYKRLLELKDDDYQVYHNYAEMLQKAGRISEALEVYRKAVILNPTSAETSNNLALILRGVGEFDEALGLLFNALNYDPDISEISVNIYETIVLLAEKNYEQALKISENWLKSYPDNAFAKYLSAIFRGCDVENNQVYVQKLFDNFADNYELVMQNLDYSVPMVMGRIAGSLEGCIVDLGCGTGFVGKALKNDRNKIIGVDISSKMLECALSKKVYDKLIQSDIEEYLQNSNDDFDWVVAADVFGYIGNMSKIIKLLKNKSLLFSIEVLHEDDKDYTLTFEGRYKHNPLYVERILKENGFEDIRSENVNLRLEKGIPVKGMIFICK